MVLTIGQLISHSVHGLVKQTAAHMIISDVEPVGGEGIDSTTASENQG